VAASVFASTAYWVYIEATTPDLPMALAWLPALLAMAHGIEAANRAGAPARAWAATAWLALLFYLCALHSVLAALPIALALVAAYALLVFPSRRSVLQTGSALGLGLVLYSPSLWSYMEAARYSHRNAGTGFYPHASFDPERLAAQGLWMLSQAVLGHNRYGLYLVVVLVMLVWWAASGTGEPASSPVRRVVVFAAWATVSFYLIEFFHELINDAKRDVPILRGWDVTRVWIFAPFGLLTLFAWMLDRTVFDVSPGPPDPGRRRRVRWALAAAGTLGIAQMAYAALRLRQVQAPVPTQQAVLYLYFALYVAATIALLFWLVRWATSPEATPLGRSGLRPWLPVLIVLPVALLTSVQAYRTGLVHYRGVGAAGSSDHIMSYAQRYRTPDDIQAVKDRNTSAGRVVDLTRPLTEATWMEGSAIAMLPLAGLRTPAGYSNLYPSWYGLLLGVGVNGKSDGLWNIVEVEASDRTNYQVLPLLDVQYILARPGPRFSGYRPVGGALPGGKVLHQVEDDNNLGPAFLSAGWRCFASDQEARQAIHAAGLADLRSRAVLVAEDQASMPFCAGKEPPEALTASPAAGVLVTRGADRVTIGVESRTGGILTLSDTYYPGWKVLVDGTEKPMLRTYTALRGVMIGPGHHTVEFRYEPGTYQMLFKVSGGGLAALLLVATVLWLRERWSTGATGQPRKMESLTGAGSL